MKRFKTLLCLFACCFALEPALAETELPSRYTNSLGMRFVLIQPGTYLSGPDWLDGAAPPKPEVAPPGPERVYVYRGQTWIRIQEPFYLQTTELTQGQWRRLMPDMTEVYLTDSNVRVKRPLVKIQDFAQRYIGLPLLNPENIKHWILGEGDQYPLHYALWRDAAAFTDRLSRREGLVYRLPTAGEWEYAAHGGTQGNVWWGRNLNEIGKYANCGSHDRDLVDHFAYLAPVGSYAPNPWGLYDMLGNVAELLAQAPTSTSYGGLEAMYSAREYSRLHPREEPQLTRWHEFRHRLDLSRQGNPEYRQTQEDILYQQISVTEIRGGDFSTAAAFCNLHETRSGGIAAGTPYQGAVGFRVLLEAESVRQQLKKKGQHP